MRTSTIEIFREEMKFSAGHFTIWSQTARERLHGHNFSVYCALTGGVDANGLVADYDVYKGKLLDVMRQWDEIFLLPGKSPYLKLRERGQHVEALFGDEIMSFLKKDVLILPVANISVEELSALLLREITQDAKALEADRLTEIVVKVASAPGQQAAATWKR